MYIYIYIYALRILLQKTWEMQYFGFAYRRFYGFSWRAEKELGPAKQQRGVALPDDPAGSNACGESGPCKAELTLLSRPRRNGSRKHGRWKGSSSFISNIKSLKCWRRIQPLQRLAYWYGGSKDFALLSISERLGVSSYWSSKLSPLNNMINNLFADTFPSLLYMHLT